MNRNDHQEIQNLLLAEWAGDIANEESQRLRQHLKECSLCASHFQTLQLVVQDLKSYQVQTDPQLILRTQRVIHHKAQELQKGHGWNVVLWGAAAFSWIWIFWSAPWLWKVLDWLGHYWGLPAWTWQMAFGFWWLLPALMTAAVLGIYREERLLLEDTAPAIAPLMVLK